MKNGSLIIRLVLAFLAAMALSVPTFADNGKGAGNNGNNNGNGSNVGNGNGNNGNGNGNGGPNGGGNGGNGGNNGGGNGGGVNVTLPPVNNGGGLGGNGGNSNATLTSGSASANVSSEGAYVDNSSVDNSSNDNSYQYKEKYQAPALSQHAGGPCTGAGVSVVGPGAGISVSSVSVECEKRRAIELAVSFGDMSLAKKLMYDLKVVKSLYDGENAALEAERASAKFNSKNATLSNGEVYPYDID